MGGSFQIGKLFGIPIKVHVLFLLLVAFYAFMGFSEGSKAGGFHVGLVQGLRSGLFIIALFGCVVVHELSHSLVARRYGVKVESITLLPIGGVSSMEEMPRKPSQELTMAIAGPLASIGVAGVFFVVSWALNPAQPLPRFSPMGQHLVADLVRVNLLLAAFNILPAFPMDGGRVLRAVLATHMSYVAATRIAAGVGQGVAVLMGVAGLILTGNFWLIIIAIFIFLGAGAEERQVRIHALLENVPVTQAMIPRFETMPPDYPLGYALQYASQGYQHDFPIVDGGHIIGIVTRQGLIEGLSAQSPQVPVRSVMRTDICQATPGESLADVYVRLAKVGCPVALVVDQQRVVGLVTPDSVQAYLAAAVQRATYGGGGPSQTGSPDIV